MARREISQCPSIGTLFGVFAQGRVQPPAVTLFKGWTRLTTDDHGEMQGAPLQGFYAANTLFVTHYEMRVNDEIVSHRLSAQLSENEWSTTGAVLRSGDSGNLPKGTLPKGSIEIRVLRKIDQGWTDLVFVKNNGIPPRKIRFELRFCCPIRDDQFSEEMKTEERLPLKGIVPKTIKTPDVLNLCFERDFGKRKHVPTEELRKMYGDQAPREGDRVSRALEVSICAVAGSPSSQIHVKPGKVTVINIDAELGSRSELCLEFRFSPVIDEYRLSAPHFSSLEPIPTDKAAIQESALHIESSNSTLNLILGQAMMDLRSLHLPVFGLPKVGNERYTAFNAGIPRYIGLFGRDNLITAWQSPLFGHEVFESALARLELLQGVRRDDWRDEEVNRLLHERRLDPRSETGEVNRLLYYGDVTSTPFWVIALSTLYQWSGERELLSRHKKTVYKCCEWILERLKEGNGFVYYAPAIKGTDDENRNQAWKDSGHGIVDIDGGICVPPLAVAEIQGYAYQALIEAAVIHEILGDSEDSEEVRDISKKYRQAAQALKSRFNQEFWIEKEKFYAVALDGDRKVVSAKASNVGHCLSTGILAVERIPAVVRAFMAEDMFSGWGIRTLSEDNPGYDPFSYHRGAVWPVENAFLAHGMAEAGFMADSHRITTAQLSVAALFQHMRLPEVLSGHSRSPQAPTPGVYNFGNSFQAWSVSAIVLHLQTILGIRPRAGEGLLYLDPHLPEWLEWIELKNLKIGNCSLHLRFWRDNEGRSCWTPHDVHGDIQIKQGVPEPFGQSFTRGLDESQEAS